MQRRVLVLVAVVVLFAALVAFFVRSGPDPEAGKCVDARSELVGCGDRAALYRLVREVDDGRECPAASRKLYTFRSSVFCGVALRGAPAPSGEYVSCLLLAGARLARDAGDLDFAGNTAAAPPQAGRVGPGAVKLRGENWRIFYVLFEGQLDPGPRAVVANPAAVAFVAYVADASADRPDVAAATRCTPAA